MLKLSRDELLESLGIGQKIIARNNALPILNNVKITSEDNGIITIIANNLEMEAITQCHSSIKKQMYFTVDGHKLLNICKSILPGEDITFVMQDKDDKLNIKSRNSKFTLNTLPAMDFPSFEPAKDTNSFTISSNMLKGMLLDIESSMGRNDPRYYLNGALIDIVNGTMRLIATDGHRLAKCEISGIDVPNLQAILPAKFVQITARDMPDNDDLVTVGLGEKTCYFQWGSTTISTKLIDAKYPEYERVIPKNQTSIVQVDTKELLGIVARSLTLKSEKYFGIKLMFSPNNLQLEAISRDNEKFNDNIDIDYQGTDQYIGFNAEYIIDVLNAIHSPTVQLDFTDHTSSMTILDPNDNTRLHVVMPMRL